MDRQNQIGIGAAALVALTALAFAGSNSIAVPVAIICGAFAVWGFWPIVKSVYYGARNIPDPDAVIISLECAQCARPIIRNGRSVNTIGFLPLGRGGIGMESGPDGMPAALGGRQIRKCTITNHSDAPLFDVRIFIEQIFREAIRDPKNNGGITTGPIMPDAERNYLLPLDRLDPGTENAFVVYLLNSSDKFVNINFPTDIEGKIGSSQKTRKLVIRKSRHADFLFLPERRIG